MSNNFFNMINRMEKEKPKASALKRNLTRLALHKQYGEDFGTIKIELWPNGSILFYDGSGDNGNNYFVFTDFQSLLTFLSNNYVGF